MSLKKANRILSEDCETPIKTVRLIRKVLEALAEPDEGEEHLVRICSKCGSVTKPDPPAFEFGDLVEDIYGNFQVVQRINKDNLVDTLYPYDGKLIWSERGVKELKLIQPGFCKISLGKIRDKLMGE